jgi:hypothetical protein
VLAVPILAAAAAAELQLLKLDQMAQRVALEL